MIARVRSENFPEKMSMRMLARAQGVGEAEQEVRAGEEIADLVCPHGRCTHDVAREHFPAGRKCERNQQQRCEDADDADEALDDADERVQR